MALDALPTRSTALQDALRDMVLTGEAAPGTRMNEAQLALRLGVSRTPVRAALNALAGEGLLHYAANRGFTVRVWPASAVADAFEVRAVLEGLACRLAAQRRLSHAQRATMLGALTAGDAVVGRRRFGAADLPAYRRANVAFHEAIIEAAASPLLADMICQTLRRPGSSHLSIAAFSPAEVRRRHDDHHRILAAIDRNEGWRAEVLMREHVAGVQREHLGAVRGEGGDAVRRDVSRA